MKPLTAERLREVVSYNPETGIFVRLIGRPGISAGTVLGSVNDSGYTKISVDGQPYRAGRLAWLYMTGQWPAQFIDHKNGNRGDDRFENLRDVAHPVNAQNMRRPSARSTTGKLGVIFHRGAFVARMLVNGRQRQFGRFKTADEAHAAYVTAKRELHEGCTL